MHCAAPSIGIVRITMPADVVIIAAMEREIAPLVRGWRRRDLAGDRASFTGFVRDNVVVVCSGIGAGFARRAAVAAMNEHHPSVLVSAGLAGALNNQLMVGQLLEPATVIDLATGARFDGGGRGGALLSTTSVLDPAAKRRIQGAYNADAVDMEAAAVALVAAQHQCSFIAVKVISDEADFPMLPFDRYLDNRGQIRMAPFVLASIFRPAQWSILVKLARNTKRASQELCCGLDHLIKQRTSVPKPELSTKI